jgi:hypothetical protein
MGFVQIAIEMAHPEENYLRCWLLITRLGAKREQLVEL